MLFLIWIRVKAPVLHLRRLGAILQRAKFREAAPPRFLMPVKDPECDKATGLMADLKDKQITALALEFIEDADISRTS